MSSEDRRMVDRAELAAKKRLFFNKNIYWVKKHAYVLHDLHIYKNIWSYLIRTQI
jgi:hypothetical protein